ncbi:hypothetical protein [Phytohabitans rumicis]|uniref:Uncharacterized protein n=1 Tax=Phytohabitans rumicis TaxID=1076125 RepID=A0A6V8KQA8_9ACTN|nr:hypothetical protein [Phytohabitans rumicis]GFJ87373.1 hypothetical protein Prum_010150 [Phytohabitans rumicis]
MGITTEPVPARTDLTAAGAEPAVPAIAATRVRRHGAVVAAGALMWAAGIVAFGLNPPTEVGVSLSDLIAVPFQLGLFALVHIQSRTGAAGTSRAARVMLRIEYVLLALATAWSILHGAVPAWRDDAWLAVLDLFWPLSMLGMFAIGVKIAVAGRWRGPARFWPLVAESWAVVTVPATIALGDTAGQWVGAGHLLIGYAVLGLILARRPALTDVRD